MNLSFHPHDSERLEQRLRAGARRFGPEPSPALRGRIVSALRAAPATQLGRPRERAGTALAAAAAILVLCSAWWLARGAAQGPARAPSLVDMSRGLFGAGTRVLALPGAVEDNLRLEAERLLADTTRVAEGVVRGLPAPLRARLERM